MTRTLYVEKIPSVDPRLKRHVYHDSESRRYAFDTSRLSVTSVEHPRHIPILDQGQIGSCTGNAGVGSLATDPLFAALPAGEPYPLDEAGALRLYSDAETIDGDGPYPPNDYGSSGLSIAKALKNAGVIAGYQHTFSLDDALKALSATSWIAGMNWYDAMYTPDPDGRVHVSGSLAGGHEIVSRQLDAERERVWFDNSWGTGWGVDGRFYLTFDDFGTLLDRQGDVTIFVPVTDPAPIPAPVTYPPDDADRTLAIVAGPWSQQFHWFRGNRQMADATKAWLAAKSL